MPVLAFFTIYTYKGYTMKLVYKHEKPLFLIAALLSSLFWLLLVFGTLGIALIYLLIIWLFFIFAHSAFISYLRGTGVKITANQYPDLRQKLLDGCKTVGLNQVPDAYLLRTDFFNALATRFLGRNFVVLFTDVVDALEDQPNAVDFYIGHELGHIHRNHLVWSSFVAPAMVLPLLGFGLRRAEEYTCDRYGAACCESEEDIKAAISAIAAGDTRWKNINVDAYLEQVQETKRFWMSFNELTSDYPWLTKRMAAAIAFKKGEEAKQPRRNVLAWLFALFVPRVGLGVGGGVVSMLMVIAIIGILAAIALPAYQDYTQKAKIVQAMSWSSSIKSEVTNYYAENGEWPYSLQNLGYEKETIVMPNTGFKVGVYEEGTIAIYIRTTDTGDQYVIETPVANDGGVQWRCSGENIPVNLLPTQCR